MWYLAAGRKVANKRIQRIGKTVTNLAIAKKVAPILLTADASW